MSDFPSLSLVIGGVSSGKSRWAEQLTETALRPKIYIATAEAHDVEMSAKIARHQASRGADWQTVDAPLALAGALADCPNDGVILVDCLTMWLSNHLLASSDLADETSSLISQLQKVSAPAILVSGEVGASVVPENALARQFQAELGRLNQSVAGAADLVVTVIAGLPMVLKGTLPGGME